MQVVNTREVATCVSIRWVTVREEQGITTEFWSSNGRKVVHVPSSLLCVVSPHVLGEVLVVSESGAAKLWTVGRGWGVFILWDEGVYWFLSQINVNWHYPIRMQKVREEDQNLYFNAKSSWRWCEFSAHPRVMLYADRTGVELTDIRVRQEILVMWWLILFPFECGQVECVFLKLNWKAASSS